MLPLVPSVTLATGFPQGSMPAYVSIAAGFAVAMALFVFMVRRRSAFRKSAALATDGLAADALADDALADDAEINDALATDTEDPTFSMSSSPDQIDDDPPPTAATPLWPPASPSLPWSALEPVLDLEAPGPGVLGRLRRRPLADLQARRPTLRALADDAPSSAHEPDAKQRPTPSRSQPKARSTNGPARKKPASVSAPPKGGRGSPKTSPTGKSASKRTVVAGNSAQKTRNSAQKTRPPDARRATSTTSTEPAKRGRPARIASNQ